jgi:Tol biopolymer transport system component
MGTLIGSTASSCAVSLPADIARRTIAFDSDRIDFQRQLYWVRANGADLTRVLTDGFLDKEPAFSPDGRKLAFSSDRAGAGTTQIFVLDLSTWQITKLTSRAEGADQPAFSRDGVLVAFHSGASVYVVGADGSNERLVATGLDSFNAYFWPSFSADDTQLVFDRNNEIDAAVFNPPSLGSPIRMIVQNTTMIMKQPAVGPDGQDVAYQSQCTGPTSVWTTPFSVTTDVCKGRRVTPVGETASRPAWGTTTYLAYERVDATSNVATIAVISRAIGSTPCVITDLQGDNRNPTWSP